MRRLLLTSLLLCLPVAAKEQPQLPAQLAATHGYVHVAFPKGGAQVLTVEPVGKGRPQRLDTSAAAVAVGNAQAFGKWLPAGRYRVAQWGLLNWKEGPEFEVQAGRVTDLGDLAAFDVGGYATVLVPLAHAEHAGGLQAATQPFASLLKDPAPITAGITQVQPPINTNQGSTGLGLVADLLMAYDRKVNKPSTREALKKAQDPAEFVRLARAVTVPLQDEPARLSDGTLLFPADLGQLRKRTPAGEWSSVGIDTLRQILSVEAVEGRVLSGSDDGRVRESRDGGATWTELKAFARNEAVVDIDHAGGTWVLTTTQTFDDPNAERGGGLIAAAKGTPSIRMRVYTGKGADLGDLAVSKEFVIAPKDQIGWLGARGQLVDGQYYVMAGNGLQRLDLPSGQWSTITPGERISSHRVDVASGVITALWSQGAFSKVYVSSDKGTNWAAIGRPPYIIFDVQMDGLDKGWASRLNMGAFSSNWETYAYSPATKDWARSGEAPFQCKLMRVSPDYPTFCITPDASVLAMREGKWEVEFSGH